MRAAVLATSPAWRRALLALAALLAAVLVRQLYTAGAPLPGLRGPGVYPVAALVALCLAGYALPGGWRRAPLAAGALAFAVFVANDRVIASGDTHGTALLPYRIVRDRSLTLDGLIPPPAPYWVVERGGHAWSRYPVAAAVLAVPVYLPAALGPGRPGALPQTEKLAAALFSAVSVGFVLAALRRAGAPPWLVVAATALYALASPVLSTTSQALWQHGPGVLGLSGALWAALRARDDDRWAAVAGAFCGLAIAARPTDVILAAGVVAALAARGWRPLALGVLGTLPGPVLVAAYQVVAFGSPWATGYGSEAAAFTTPLGEGLWAVLLSPTRGLLAFVPWAAVGALGLARGARRDPLAAGVAVATAATLVMYARWHGWWGGWCYGPRLLADVTPALALGLAYAAPWPRRALVPALAATGMLALALNGIGAFASRSAVAQAVYTADGASLAMEGWRWPPARLLGLGARSR
ncbi:MAG TPA: hypothetical protein VM683_11550 [Anaeromyxobacteraceae bacterium]|nr:hypothetical protein [Anaeromyxobacteraceae bacterium]